jgi:hypothetical protein
VWTYGYSNIGDVTFESAAYVARYVTKKINGEMKLEHYQNYCDLETGEIVIKQPEYATMSRKPGIAAGWFKKYYKDIYPKDEFTIRYKKMRPGKYYDYLMEDIEDGLIADIKQQRRYKAQEYEHENSAHRLEAKKKVKLAQIKTLVRDYEEL